MGSKDQTAAQTARAVQDYLGRDQFAKANGMEVVEVRPGYARARMTVRPEHLNSVGLVHGGALFTLADLAFAGACNAAGRLAVGMNMTIACVKASSSGTIEAEATEVARSRRVSTCTVRVTDAQGELLALFQGLAYVKSEPYPPQG